MTAYYNENDPFAAAWLRELIKAGHIAPGEVDTRSIEDVVPSDLAGFRQCHFFAGIGVWSYALRLAGWPDDRPVWTGSCPCFPADTMIHTDEGLIPIQDIRIGMNVLTHKKRWQKVLRIGCDSHKTTVVVKGQGHYGLACTPNHPFLTPEDTWVAAEHMVKRRWINACCQPAVAIPVPEKTVRGLTVRGGRFRVTGWKDGKAVYLGTYGSAEEAKNVRDAAIAKGIISVRGADNVDVTSGAFAYFLGRWIGDGWITGDNILLCDSLDKESEIVSTMREAGMSHSVSRERTTVRARCGSKWLSGYLSKYFGTRSGNKKLPAWLLGAPLEYVQRFIQGWVDSDGSLDRNCLEISTVSKNLAIGLKFLLLRCGFSPILTRTEGRKTVIEGRTVTAKAYIRVSWYPSSRSFRFGVHGGEGLVRKVLPGVSADVYNLEVEEDNSYVADGIVVHNCQPFSAAGKRKGTADERHLWPAFFHLIRQCRPVTVFGEQVASKDGLSWLDLVSSDLEGAGYACGAVDTCAAGFGAPHIRQRLYWVAHATSSGDRSFNGQSEEGFRPQEQAGGYSFSDRLGNTVSKRLERYAGDVCGTDGWTLSDRPASETTVYGRLADTASVRRDQRRGSSSITIQGNCTERDRKYEESKYHGELQRRLEGLRGVSRLADSASREVYEEQQEPAEAKGKRSTDLHCGCCMAGVSLPTNGFWRDADWLYCRDGRWRAVEPGTLPLAHGSTNRVGRLRGYGNAIVAPQAEAFIRAYMETMQEDIWSSS